MPKFTSPLDGVRVAAPCSADWESMSGDERVRFCSECSLNVYNLSTMSRRDAEALIAKAEGRFCVRYYRRKDGAILTRNCPVGLRALKRRVAGVARAAASTALSFFAGIAAFAGWRAADDYGRAELSAHAIPAPEMPDLSEVTVEVGDLMPESFEAIQGLIVVEPRDAWVNGRVMPTDAGEVERRTRARE